MTEPFTKEAIKIKKLIFMRILCVALPCVAALSVTLIFLFFGKAGENGEVNHYAIAVTASVATVLAVVVTAGFVARKLTEKIVKSLENIGQKNENFSRYEELTQYAMSIEQQRQTFRSRIEELSNRADAIKAITESMDEGLILIDSDGVILTANNSAQQVFGDSIEKRNIIHVCRNEAFQDAVKQCTDGKNAEVRMERGDRIYSVFFSPVFPANRARTDSSMPDAVPSRGAVILFHDATESLKAEKQRREFSANVSHELKTPLTTISAISEMIEQGMTQESDIKAFAGRINEQAGRLLVLIDDIIRLSEFDEGINDTSGKANREVTDFDLWELAETVINALRDHAGSIEILLTGERFEVSAHHRMIDELLYNLIDNGVKYNKESGKVTVNLTQTEEGLCRISVSDTGIGINNEHHPHIFERFYRVDKSRSKKTGGTGLGLSIVKHITEHYNGRLELESTEGSGTTVICYLPV